MRKKPSLDSFPAVTHLHSPFIHQVRTFPSLPPRVLVSDANEVLEHRRCSGCGESPIRNNSSELASDGVLGHRGLAARPVVC